jgi:hypothetical protein
VGCTGEVGNLAEWAYVASLRYREIDACWGSLLRLTLPAESIALLEHSFQNTDAFERMWSGLQPDDTELTFVLCAAHWMDLSYLSGVHGRQYQRGSWSQVATDLLHEICRAAGWDAREIANQVVWQRVLLT